MCIVKGGGIWKFWCINWLCPFCVANFIFRNHKLLWFDSYVCDLSNLWINLMVHAPMVYVQIKIITYKALCQGTVIGLHSEVM